jgi:hypothetical protein
MSVQQRGEGPNPAVVSQALSGYEVTPGTVHVTQAEGLIVENRTGSRILVALPGHLTTDPTRPGRQQRLERHLGHAIAEYLARATVVEAGDTARLSLAAQTKPDGEDYHIVVFPADGSVPAEGNSAPRIKVDG